MVIEAACELRARCVAREDETKSMKKSFFGLASFAGLAALTAAACGSSEGAKGEACYPNGTCDTGLVCSDGTCIDPNPSASGGSGSGNNGGIDTEACFACGDAVCASQRSQCDATLGCADLAECTVGCGTDFSCSSSCTVNGLSAEELAAAGAALAGYTGCVLPACPTECSAPVGGSGGGANGSGGAGGIDDEACLTCGDVSCPSERAECDATTGCTEFLNCAFDCGSDQSCVSGCGASISSEELSDVALTAASYLTCAATNCTAECGGGGGGGNTGGASGAGGTSGSGGAPGTGGSGSTLGPGELYDGTGVNIQAPDYDAVGSFFVLEDGVADGAPVSDSLTHTDLDPPGSSAEPSTFEGEAAACVSGTIAVVTDSSGGDCELDDATCAWGDLWGGGIGATLNQQDGMTAMAWDGTSAGATGFSFTTSGSAPGVPMRFFVEDTAGNQFCTTVPLGAKSEVLFSELQHECWDPTSTKLDPTKIKQLSWQFVPDASSSYSISNFCVVELGILE